MDDPLVIPFDISLAPPNFGTNDAPGQEVAMSVALRAPGEAQDNGEGFSDRRPQDLPLRLLQSWYDEGQATQAIGSLVGRKTITLAGSSYTVKADDGNIFSTVKETYLDLLICVGKGLGLGPLLPNSEVLHTYKFTLDTLKHWRQFTARYAKLGFDPTDSMLWIGNSPSSEDIWLAFVPKTFTDDGGDVNDDIAAHWRGPRSTTLSTKHYRQVVMFLAKMLFECIFLDVTLEDPYPDVMNDDEYNHATNLQ